MTTSSTRYLTHPHLQARWDAVGRAHAFAATTTDEAGIWRRETISRLKQIIGYDTMEEADLSPDVTEEIVLDGYIRQRVEIQTEPGVFMPLYVLIPETGPGVYPAVIAPHGHGGGGKATVAGCRETPALADAIDRYNYDYGVQLVRAGFIVFCPDARGFGERQERGMDDPLSSCCQWLNNMALPLGQTVTGMWTWDLHRLIDYVETRPDCDAHRIACAGLSGGGLQTLWATALDQRIRCAVISGYMYGYRESLLDLYANCSCNYVPHLYETVDMGDIAALIAPRPLFVESGDADPLNGANGVANVESQMAIIRRAYAVYGAEEQVEHDVFAGEHRWHGVRAIPWLQRQLV